MMSRLKISQKLLAAFGLLIAILVCANAVLFVQLRAIQKDAEASYEAATSRLLVEQIMGSVIEQQNAIRAYSVSADPKFLKTYTDEGADSARMLDELVDTAGTEEIRSRRERLRAAYQRWRAEKAQRQIDLIRQPATREAGLAMTGESTLGEVRGIMAEIIDATEARDNKATAQLRGDLRTGEFVLAIGAVAVFAAALAMAMVLTRSIAQPVRAMTEAMRKLAGGDNTVDVPARDRKDEIGEMAGAVQVFKDAAIEKLRLEGMTAEQAKATEEERARNEAAKAEAARQQQQVVDSIAEGLTKLSAGDLVYRISQPFSPEYEKLRADFNGAMAQLQDTMKVITAATQGIRSGTDEISQAADDLSKRTEQQAASLEETAAALDEITATVRKTAEGANHARDVVSTAKNDAEHSGEVVRNAVSAMSEIEKSATQISQIIGVIDEIAFQTNLLALNAGVEAARAGDAGKGFAVVASEVRALAQRSADAAKEIKTLISASTQQVGSGVALVGETGQALERIVGQVAEITTIVSEIAASAQEQATGLNQVNTAVNQMDQVTQQNAAMVEQSTAASHSLAGETEELARLISRFQVGEAPAAAGRRPARAANPAPAPSRAPMPAMKTVSTHSGGGGALPKAASAPAHDVDNWEEF
jgi:methyl-accepting chemotaxis protein